MERPGRLFPSREYNEVASILLALQHNVYRICLHFRCDPIVRCVLPFLFLDGGMSHSSPPEIPHSFKRLSIDASLVHYAPLPAGGLFG